MTKKLHVAGLSNIVSKDAAFQFWTTDCTQPPIPNPKILYAVGIPIICFYMTDDGEELPFFFNKEKFNIVVEFSDNELDAKFKELEENLGT